MSCVLSPPRWLKALVPMLLLALATNVLARASRAGDARNWYDVLTYRLHFIVRPDSEIIDGTNVMTVRFVRPGVDSLALDAGEHLVIQSVEFLGQPPTALNFRRSGDRLKVALPNPLPEGTRATFRFRFRYRNGAVAQGPVHFVETVDGIPWVSTSCQLTGAHQWWPCKASFYHPEDKPDSIWIALTFPDSLYGIANGRFLGEEVPQPGWKTTRWLMVHPRLTYLVAIYVGPYVELTQTQENPRSGKSRFLHYYVLRQDTAKARAEFFPRVPDLVRQYETWYGPFAFWDEKFALVQSSIPGMEHSTAVAVGPVFPHTLKPGDPNPLAWYEEYFNYMAVHETAHEWWGNAVSALDWGEFWLHEGFATYTEALWVEHLYGPEVMHQYMAKLSFRIDSTQTVYRPRHQTSREAYHLNIYWKGAWVLHMLRYVMGDSAFFAALREFNTSPRFRYANATTADFQRICERIYGGDLSWFFLEWVYRPGWPKIQVKTQPQGRRLVVDIHDTCFVHNEFRMPVDLQVETAGGTEIRRLWATPGRKRMVLQFNSTVREAEPIGLRWILDGPKRGELWYFTDLDFVKGKFLHNLEFTDDRRLYVGSDSAAWESPARSLFPGAQWLRIYVDSSNDARLSRVRLLVREYQFLTSRRRPWIEPGPRGMLPEQLRNVRRLQYRLEFGALAGQTVPIPKVVIVYR